MKVTLKDYYALPELDQSAMTENILRNVRSHIDSGDGREIAMMRTAKQLNTTRALIHKVWISSDLRVEYLTAQRNKKRNV